MPDERRVRQQYDRIAGTYNVVDWFIPDRWRRQAVGRAFGRVLEVGVGTGLNLPFYPEQCREIVGIDLSRRMLAEASRQILRCKRPVTLAVMDVQKLEMEAGSFDCVLASFVFCTVPDPLQGLRECRRVLRPGGRLILLEHVGSDRKWPGRILNLLAPAALRLLGDHICRNTCRTVAEAGFRLQSTENLWGDVVRLCVAERDEDFRM